MNPTNCLLFNLLIYYIRRGHSEAVCVYQSVFAHHFHVRSRHSRSESHCDAYVRASVCISTNNLCTYLCNYQLCNMQQLICKIFWSKFLNRSRNHANEQRIRIYYRVLLIPLYQHIHLSDCEPTYIYLPLYGKWSEKEMYIPTSVHIILLYSIIFSSIRICSVLLYIILYLLYWFAFFTLHKSNKKICIFISETHSKPSLVSVQKDPERNFV